MRNAQCLMLNGSVDMVARAFGIGHSALSLEHSKISMPTRTQQLGLIIVLAELVTYVFIRVL